MGRAATISLTFPEHGVRLAPQWTPEGELLADLAVITRLTLTQGTTVILLGGPPVGDLIAVTATRKIGGITDTPDLAVTEPLLVLTREGGGAFTSRLDNTTRQPNE
ncbi:hypothetical protein ACIQC7_33280 [Kitasatospora sp. NPDC088556]|uniref:hypothetical protein n=1 Tax=Kitasatospora sp. NPDC088556 TaxID=3364076 RepID=UPI0037FEC813